MFFFLFLLPQMYGFSGTGCSPWGGSCEKVLGHQPDAQLRWFGWGELRWRAVLPGAMRKNSPGCPAHLLWQEWPWTSKEHWAHLRDEPGLVSSPSAVPKDEDHLLCHHRSSLMEIRWPKKIKGSWVWVSNVMASFVLGISGKGIVRHPDTVLQQPWAVSARPRSSDR